jgi:Rad3-related DNA helicase
MKRREYPLLTPIYEIMNTKQNLTTYLLLNTKNKSIWVLRCIVFKLRFMMSNCDYVILYHSTFFLKHGSSFIAI